MRPQFVSVAAWNSLSPSKTHAFKYCKASAAPVLQVNQFQLINVVWKMLQKWDLTVEISKASFSFGKYVLQSVKIWIIHMIILGFPIILGNIFFLSVLNGSLWLVRLFRPYCYDSRFLACRMASNKYWLLYLSIGDRWCTENHVKTMFPSKG